MPYEIMQSHRNGSLVLSVYQSQTGQEAQRAHLLDLFLPEDEGLMAELAVFAKTHRLYFSGRCIAQLLEPYFPTREEGAR